MIISSREKVLFSLIFTLVLIVLIGGTWILATGRTNSKADSVATTVTTSTPGTTTTTLNQTDGPTLVLKPGWNLTTIPYILSPGDGKTVFLGLATREAFSLSDSGKWVSLYQSGTITPGQGIWVRSEVGESYKIPVQAKAVDTDKSFTISLKKGWNAVGNPFPKDITWNPTVKTAKGTTTFKKAVDAKILTVGYSSDPSSKEYKTTNASDDLKAFQGILIKSGGDNIDLIVTAN